MMVLAKKVFTSSKPVIVRLLCPPPRGPFSIQENAVGGLSYKAKTRPALSFPQSRTLILWHFISAVQLFLRLPINSMTIFHQVHKLFF